MRLLLVVALLPSRAPGLPVRRPAEDSGMEDFYLEFYKELENPYNNVFTSCSATGGALVCFQRANKDGNLTRMLDRAFFSSDFRLISTERDFVAGEDPRVLNSSIVFDNTLNDLTMLDVRSKQKYQVLFHRWPAQGKNYVWFVHRSQMFAIESMDPLKILACHVARTRLQCEPFFVDNKATFENYSAQYRGGTVGYQSKNYVFGFGHRTHHVKGKLKHEVFQWKLQGMDGETPRMEMHALELPGQKNICDPTSVVVVRGKAYLITAESHSGWHTDQRYHNKVYELKQLDESKISQGAMLNAGEWNLAGVPSHAGAWDLAQTNDDFASTPAAVDLFKLSDDS